MNLDFDYVIPFQENYARVGESLRILRMARANYQIKNIFLCHNGPHTDLPRFIKFKNDLPANEILLHTDAVGIGAGYKLGIANATSRYVMLSASDLPFGLTDLISFLKIVNLPLIAIGSKGHKESLLYGRKIIRKVATFVFYIFRRLLLGPETPKDSQGTLIIEANLAKRLLQYGCSDSFLFSLQLVTYARVYAGAAAVELPVILHETNEFSSVRLAKHTIEMLKGVVALKLKISIKTRR